MNCWVLYTELCVPVRTTGSDWYAEFGVQYSTVHLSPVVLTGRQSSLCCTLQFIFHQLFWLVRRERTLRTSQNNWWNMNCSVQYNKLCIPVRTTGGIWAVAYCTTNSAVHIPPVVLTGTQSSVYSTLQFIFHQLFWLVRQNNWWNMNCKVQYSELCVPVRTTGGIWTVTCSTTNSAYQSEQLVEYEL
jgi:hypothetical protein